ncbi:restriction endonuclease subunit R [Chryseobacterium echinoideorum]|uniref:restriction endonuclease subunit R n=1 Tax=Chryseobacterium echinoideorum TaxID=1549648 RepID=UPI001186E2DB|nr:restriction endonuclease subunit R [Chryseobacterium echinoideorum]
MELNKFIWNNYKESKDGQEIINFFKYKEYYEILSKFIDEKNKDLEDYNNILNIFLYCDLEFDESKNVGERGKKLFNYFIENGLILKDEKGEFSYFEKEEFDFLLDIIEPYSLYLFDAIPDYFFPYFFKLEFTKLQKICDTFNINIPKVPLKKFKKERLNYYIELCDIFLEFRTINNLTKFEFCAFLYDFAPKYIGFEEIKDLPEPTNIWLCGAAKDDYSYLLKATSKTTYFWQGNEDTKRGDIIVMYCLSPQSNIEFICRAVNDGIRDPFFHYYGSITLGNIHKIQPIHISQIKTDEHLKNIAIVKKNLQGVNGTQISNEDYKRILYLLEEKGENTLRLPKISTIDFKVNLDCRNERDVEIKIVEPFLHKLNYFENDWIRQLSVRMGRGERNYPDYVFFAETRKGYEQAKMLLETKFIIKNNRDLEETFQQAHSYALRLEAQKIVICDKDFIWIYSRKNNSFDRTKYLKFNWHEINNPDIYSQIKKIIGKDFIK